MRKFKLRCAREIKIRTKDRYARISYMKWDGISFIPRLMEITSILHSFISTIKVENDKIL